MKSQRHYMNSYKALGTKMKYTFTSKIQHTLQLKFTNIEGKARQRIQVIYFIEHETLG